MGGRVGVVLRVKQDRRQAITPESNTKQGRGEEDEIVPPVGLRFPNRHPEEEAANPKGDDADHERWEPVGIDAPTKG